MSDQRRFGRRRRGMHFKPSGHGPKISKHQEREAQQARAEEEVKRSRFVVGAD